MSNKRYKITITEFSTEEKTCGKQWEQVRTSEEVKGTDKSTFGYTPEIKKQVDFEREILKQNVDKLNIVNVIKAINEI